jgi:hypothetical protein
VVDGVYRLVIERLHRTAFKMMGIAFAPNALVPFELEFHFQNRRDQTPARKILRIGDIDNKGVLRRHSSKSIEKLFQVYPDRNWPWAIEVEFH